VLFRSPRYNRGRVRTRSGIGVIAETCLTSRLRSDRRRTVYANDVSRVTREAEADYDTIHTYLQSDRHDTDVDMARYKFVRRDSRV